jgi:hypothetical protein
MEVCQPHPSPHQSVEPRRGDLAAERADIRPSQIVGDNKEDVWTFDQTAPRRLNAFCPLLLWIP